MQKNLIIITLLSSLFIAISGCSPHRIDIQQGNKIEPEVLASLKTGMNRQQVVYLLGTPLLQDAFHQNRWDYIYYMKPGNEDAKQSRVTLFFEGDKLINIDKSGYKPEAQENHKNTK